MKAGKRKGNSYKRFDDSKLHTREEKGVQHKTTTDIYCSNKVSDYLWSGNLHYLDKTITNGEVLLGFSPLRFRIQIHGGQYSECPCVPDRWRALDGTENYWPRGMA